MVEKSTNRLQKWHSCGAIGHFRVPPRLCIKTRLGAQPLIWKWFFILTQIKLIFTRKVVHLASFWKWRFLELGRGLFVFSFLCDCPRNFNGNGGEKYYRKKQIDLNFPCSILLSTMEVTSICSKLQHIEQWNLNFEHFDVIFMADKNYRLKIVVDLLTGKLDRKRKFMPITNRLLLGLHILQVNTICYATVSMLLQSSGGHCTYTNPITLQHLAKGQHSPLSIEW